MVTKKTRHQSSGCATTLEIKSIFQIITLTTRVKSKSFWGIDQPGHIHRGVNDHINKGDSSRISCATASLVKCQTL